MSCRSEGLLMLSFPPVNIICNPGMDDFVPLFEMVLVGITCQFLISSMIVLYVKIISIQISVNDISGE